MTDTTALIAELRTTQGYAESELRFLCRQAALALEALSPQVVGTVEELDALPVGSVILSFEPSEPESPAVACRAARGWQFLGDDPERRYPSSALIPSQWPIRVLFRPTREENPDPYACPLCGETTAMGPHRPDCPEVLNGTAHPDTMPDQELPARGDREPFNLPERLKSVYHDELLAIEPGSYSVEKERHRYFMRSRVPNQKEWFNESPELILHINDLRAQYGDPMAAWDLISKAAA